MLRAADKRDTLRAAELLPQGRFELVERSRTFIPEDNPKALALLISGG
jgi:hypothetical protein